MSERQAKRLRRATRAYIRANQKSLATDERAAVAGAKRAGIVRELWPRLNHRGRGVVGGKLGCRYGYINNDLDGALRVMGVLS